MTHQFGEHCRVPLLERRAAIVPAVRRHIDRRETEAIESTLAGCSSTDMVVLDCGLPTETRNIAQRQRPRRNPSDALERWDDNGNGQITCAEARHHVTREVYGLTPMLLES